MVDYQYDYSFLKDWIYTKSTHGDFQVYCLQSNKDSWSWVEFIVGHRFTAVTGDFGNHTFGREFHPHKVTVNIDFTYALEKYRYCSTQNPTSEYSPTLTREYIEEFMLEHANGDLDNLTEEEREQFDYLLYYSESEIDYLNQRFNEHDDNIIFLEYDQLQPQYELDKQVNFILHVFIEMCKRESYETDTKT